MTYAICVRLLKTMHEWHDFPNEACKEKYEIHKHRRHLKRVLDQWFLNGFERSHAFIRIGRAEFITYTLAIMFVAKLRGFHQGSVSSH